MAGTNPKPGVVQAENHGTKEFADMSNAEVRAKVYSMPEVSAGTTISLFRGKDNDLSLSIAELQSHVADVHNGNMKRPETFLVAQAHTLDEIFNAMTRRAVKNMEAGYGDACERYMRIALKAQSQCRTTIEALSAIKNPPVIYAKQANISNGPQQVNNGIPAPAHTGEIINYSNELLEDCHVQRMDTRATAEPIGTHQTVETVGKLNRASN